MIAGIVGSEASKFTHKGMIEAKTIIRQILSDSSVTEVVSGKCHLGGIDIWAAEIGNDLGLKVTEFPPKRQSWEGGYRERNLQIAESSDIVYCITVNRLPSIYRGMTFDSCYHCHSKDHIKSGGCWTMKQAIKMGKRGILKILDNREEV